MIDRKCIDLCECNSMLSDTKILDILNDHSQQLTYAVRADGKILFDRPHALLARNLREGIRWLVSNKKL